MAEIYPPGINRIFYRAKAFKEGLSVTVDLLDPDLNNHIDINLIEISSVKGFYYFDCNFREGPYIAYFYENGVESWSQAYSIRKEPSGGVRSFLGDNVIGG